MKILVIGGAGYIGSHVSKALNLAGYEVVVFDNFSTGHPWAAQFGSIIQGDIDDQTAIRQALMDVQPSAVIHLAGLINLRDSIHNPGPFYENLFGTLNLLNAMVETNVKYIVFSSSAAIFGNPEYLPIDEAHPKRPQNAYGRIKLMLEGMLEDFSNAHNLNFAALRYFNACGADPEAKIGEAHSPETHLIPLAIRAATGRGPILKVFGNDYDTLDGTAVRDYIHVLDLANAHVRALKYLFQNHHNLQLNLGTGTGYSVKQVIDAIQDFAKMPVPLELHPKFDYDSSALVADPSKAKEVLGWEPVHSSLLEIISTAWRWEEAHLVRPQEKLKALREKSLHRAVGQS